MHRSVWFLCVVAVAVAACGDGDPGAVVLRSAAGSPGTLLGDGFEVVGGTILIGDPIPLGGEVPHPLGTTVEAPAVQVPVDDGWTATSIVDGGDPKEVIDAYLDQAEAAGLVEQTGTGCYADADRGEVFCSGFARSTTPEPPRSLSVDFVRGQRGELVSDHIVVRYSTALLYWEHGQARTDVDPDLPLPRSPAWPSLPSPGEQLPDGGEPVAVLTIEEGSRLAGPAHLDLDDTTGGINAILEVTGDPASVLGRYRDQLAAEDVHGREPITQSIDGATVTTFYADQAGGDSFALTLVERADRPTWLFVDASHD